jgi:hypothetical protein
VLVVDRVELVLVHELEQVGELHRDHAARLEQELHAADEIIDVRHVRQHVVAEQEIRPALLGGDRGRGLPAEELDGRRDALGDRGLRDVRCRLDAATRHAARDEVLQQIAVVARDLHDQRLRAELQPPDHRFDVAPGVLHPAVGVRREVGVVGKDVVGCDVHLQLHQEAALAHPGVQRIEALHVIQLVRLNVRLTKRRHAEIDERVVELLGAEAAARGRGRQPSPHVGRRRRGRLLPRCTGHCVSPGPPPPIIVYSGHCGS